MKNHLGNALVASAEGSRLRPTVEERDPILAVAGVSSAEILRRCNEIRGLGRPSRGFSRRAANAGAAIGGWRLVDLADLSQADFVREAHRMFLGRRPSSTELERRLRDLQGHSSRMEIVVRLALSPEGRRAVRPRTRGIGLPALAAVGAAIEAADASPLLAPAVRSVERIARSALSDRLARRRTQTRAVATAVSASAVIVIARRFRRSGSR